MAWPAFSRRVKIGLAAVALGAIVVLFPLRIALDLAGAAGNEVNARQVRGLVWHGRIDDLMIGGVNLGTVKASVSPVQLLVGRIRLDLWREGDGAGALAGAVTRGFNQIGMDDVTGTVPAGGLLAPLPVGTLEFDDVTVHFAGDTCAKAEGRLRVRLSGQYAGLNLSQGLSGDATCDGAAALFPLVSQTGMERISLRFWRDGRYTAQLAVKGEEGTAAALAGAGLTRNGEDYVLTLEGRM